MTTLVLAGALTVAPAASAVIVRGPGAKRFGVIPHRGISARAVHGSLAAQQPNSQPADDGTLSYHGGPVVHSSSPYLIFWAPGSTTIPQSTQSLLARYFQDAAADSGTADDVFGVSRQYSDGTGFADYQQSFDASKQVLIDTDPYPPTDQSNCPDTSPQYPTCITDAQLETELQQEIAAHDLPTDGSTSADELSQNAPVYFLVLPSNVNVCTPPSTPDSSAACADNVFCAYHSTFTDGSNNVLYAVIPTLLAAQEPKACQDDGNTTVQEPNGDLGDVVISDMSHEYNETITDPLLTAWYDDVSGNEEADNCVFYGRSADPANGASPSAFAPTLGGSATPGSGQSTGTLYDQTINGENYYTQSEWSNGDTSCELQPSSGTISPSFTEPSGPNAVGTSLSFDPSASSSSHGISSETWDFGDGSQTSFHAGGLASASHTYTAAGTYTVKLTLVDDGGNVKSTTQQITIYARPDASFGFTPSTALEGTPVNFTASASDPNSGGTITDYSWDFGDNSKDSGPSDTAPTHTYAKYGTYTVKLTVANSEGLTTTISHQITITDEPPTAAFTVAPGPYEAGKPVSVHGSGSDPDGHIVSYAWNFGDGSTASGTTPAAHTYVQGGTYTITLTVTDSDGQTDTVSHSITLYPIAAFVVSTTHPAAGVPVQFNGSPSFDSGGSIAGYRWKFGDGTTGTGVEPRHTYARAGSYLVALTISDTRGGSATVSDWVVVVPGSRITKVTASGSGASKTLAVSVDGAGILRVDGRRFTVSRAKTVKIHLARTHRLKISVLIRFTPQVGAPSARWVTVTFTG